MRTPTLLNLLLLLAFLIACSSSDPESTSTRVVTPLPDPGNWRVPTGTDIGTIEQAWQVGTATRTTPYVEAAISGTTGRAYFIFTASREEIGISLSSPADSAGIDAVRLHQHTDAGVGTELASLRDGPNTGKWILIPGASYVLEVLGPKGLFF